MVRYTFLEAEAIDRMYDEGYSHKTIAEQINIDFHKGANIRNERSVGYVINKTYQEENGWYERLEEKWLAEVK
ncbi:hypothetical protein [Paenibacillus silvae]|uniref:Helix-turn-helix domain-containing protein n=1 Tax=Paenibacillus silvae TaxID=1325358 RepID=A0A2W6QJM8_9BACL|nr:hypothetical protein [Paenibacillus silvae]PZT57363.1 hypothetical protein DN757_01525 [Paenibacillus silvae]